MSHPTAQDSWNQRLATLQPLQPPYLPKESSQPQDNAPGHETSPATLAVRSGQTQICQTQAEWLDPALSASLSVCSAMLPESVAPSSAPDAQPLAHLPLAAAILAYLFRLGRDAYGDVGWQGLSEPQPFPCRVQLAPQDCWLDWLQALGQELCRWRSWRSQPSTAASSLRAAIATAGSLPVQLRVCAAPPLGLAPGLPGEPHPDRPGRSHQSSGLASPVLQFICAADSSCYWIQYDSKQLAAGAIAALQAQLKHFLQGIADQPERPLSQHPLLSREDRQRILLDRNQTQGSDNDRRCVHHLFEAQAEKTPEAIALRLGEQVLSYQSLNQRANQWADRLRHLGIGPDCFVGLCVERSFDMIIGMLAILKSGAAYLPLDPSYPPDRLAFMIDDAQPPVILTQVAIQDQLPPNAATCLCLDQPPGQESNANPSNPAPLAQPHHLAYIIYTSGSTGQPKGVMIEHRSLSNFAQASLQDYGIQGSDRVLQFASISFDAAAEEIYPCLICGGELVLRSPDMMSSVPQFLQQCQDLGLTVLDLPTAYWHLLVAELKADPQLTLPASIRIVIIGGEAVNPQRVFQWQQILWRTGSRAQLINTYGPTEATVVATAQRLPLPQAEPEPSAPPLVTIGQALCNVTVYVLDGQQQLVPDGVAGELCIGGAGIARGYLGREELTAERFLPDPFAPELGLDPAARLYRTGDLVRWLPQGEIDFLGRIDNQVKIRGFRIELGEIEAALTQEPEVQDAVVIVRQDKPAQKQLVAYIVPSQFAPSQLTSSQPVSSQPVSRPSASPMSTSYDPAEAQALQAHLRQVLAQQLPDYMVPAALVLLPSLPLTPNKKVDRRALPLPAPEDFPAAARPFVAAQGETETRLVRLWQSVLGRESVGATDNFFELGGTSLLAVKLFMQIEKQFGRSLQLSALLQAPTIQALAQVLERGAAPPRDGDAVLGESSTLVSLQPHGTKPPIFFLNSISYAQLFVPYLPQNQPFYGLNLFGATDIFATDLERLTLDRMAEAFVADMRRIQPQGPYYIGSYCGDTKLAIAIGHRLQIQGQTVGMQVFIDPMWDEPSGWRFQARNLRRFGPNYLIEKLKNRVRVTQEQATYRSRRTVGLLRNEAEGYQLQRDLDLYARYQQLCDSSWPSHYEGAVSVILCEELAHWPTPYLDSVLTRSPQILTVSGYHHTIFQPPQLEQLVHQFQSAMAAAQTTQRSATRV